jgi:hypothetical protein
MNRTLATAVLAMALIPFCLSATAQTSPSTLAEARKLLDQNNAAGAAELLEARLASARGSDRSAILGLMREALKAAAEQAQAAGKADVAEAFREDLAILERTLRPTGPGSAPESPPVDRTVERTAAGDDAPQAELKPAPAPARPAEPTAVPARGVQTLPVLEPEPTSPVPGAGGRPEPSAPAASRPASPSLPPLSAPARTVTPSAHPAATVTPDDQIRAADSAFRAKRYDDAGRLYAVLHRAGQLPRARYDLWIYCRCIAVVDRINAQPTSAKEWSEIAAEVASIQALNPKHWYVEYLRNVVAERSTKKPAPAQVRTKKVVLQRDPSEERPVIVLPATEKGQNESRVPLNEAQAVRPATEAPGSNGRKPIKMGAWMVLETANFRILAADGALAEKAAPIAESVREDARRRWMALPSREPWTPRCDIYLYPNARVFKASTGQPEESPGFSTMGMNGGRIVARRVNLRADHPTLLTAIMPHEITHVVLADLFPYQQIPRWADEGMAVLSEPSAEQIHRATDLEKPLTTGELFKLEDLMLMDYPDGKYWPLYYAQSVSLTRFLVDLGTPAQFVEFVQGSQQRGHEAELKRIYKIDSFADLQKRWVEYARAQAAGMATATGDNEKAPRSVRR